VPNIRWLIALITAVHRFLYRVTNGHIGAGSGGRQFLLLMHVGRKTGRTRMTPLLYLEDEGRLVIIGSNAGDDRHPAWWLNLQSHPEAEVQIGGHHFAVRARAATAAETERLWPKFIAVYKDYATYRARTNRTIPIVILEKASPPL
jgi:deazaflavin-dependent oxidoreductase (nitroreductase family)